MALEFDDNLKAMNLTTKRSLTTIPEDTEHVKKALFDLSVSRKDHDKLSKSREPRLMRWRLDWMLAEMY